MLTWCKANTSGSTNVWRHHEHLQKITLNWLWKGLKRKQKRLGNSQISLDLTITHGAKASYSKKTGRLKKQKQKASYSPSSSLENTRNVFSSFRFLLKSIHSSFNFFFIVFISCIRYKLNLVEKQTPKLAIFILHMNNISFFSDRLSTNQH